MKRFLHLLFCAAALLTGLVLGRYAWEAPVDDVKVVAPPSAKPRAVRSGFLPLEKALAEVNSGPRRAALLTVLSAGQDRRMLRTLVDSCRNDPAAFAFLAGLWQELDPAAFFRCALSSPVVTGTHARSNLGVLSEVITKITKTDADAAWREAERLPAKFRRVFTRVVTGELMKTNPRRALELAVQHPGSTPGFSRYAEPLDPGLLPLVQRLPDTLGKASMLENITSSRPLAEAMSMVSGTGQAESYARDQLIKNALEKNPGEVLAWLEHTEGNIRAGAASLVGDHLVFKDPAAAVEWAGTHLSGGSRLQVIREAAARLETSDPAAAEQARSLLPENFSRTPPPAPALRGSP